MNSKKFFEACKNEGIETSELSLSSSKSTSFSLFKGQIDNYSISNQSTIKARGIYNGKMGVASTEDLTSNAIKYLVNAIKEGASISEKAEAPIIYKGSKKYFKKNVFNPDLDNVGVDEKLAKLYELEKEAYALDNRVTDVVVEFSEEVEEKAMYNSYGLKLKEKANYYYYVCEVIAKDGDQNKNNFEIFIESDFSKLNVKELAAKAVEGAISKFNGKAVKSGSYKCVLNPSVVGNFINAVVNSGCDAENIQKNSSVLVGKLNQKVFSSKLTVEEKPLTKNCFFTYFDDEGVATQNKKIIDKGVLMTYLYNLDTAAKAGVESTGNGYTQGPKIGIRAINLVVKPGKKSEDDLFAKVGNGIYVTDIQGLHSGMNPQSGDFSLEAQGYFVENGKKASPCELFTIGGNIYNLFNDVTDVANNSKLLINSTACPSILVKKLKVSGM